MVGFENIKSHKIEMDQFPLKWRFTEEAYNVLPPEHLMQLQPLDREAAELLSKFLEDAGLHDDVPFRKGFFKSEEWIELKTDEEQEVRKWLYQRGLPLKTEVFLSWDRRTAMIVPWKLMIEYFDDFFYPGPDDLTVFDASLNWAIFFWHEGWIYFGTNEK